MARRIEVEIIGDSTSLERAFKRSSQQASKFNREVGKMSRGVAAGTGLFHGFGRSIAFASGGFLAFAGASRFLTDSINAAREAAVSQRALAAQMRASGDSFKANRREVERVSVSYGKFGFQNDEIVAGLTVLERGTGDINKSFRLLGLTADLARAKQLDFAQAANIVAKVFGGQETALRRAVPGLRKNAHGYDLIRQAQAKLAGQAAANTTQSERFAATLHNTEEIIGSALLPVLNDYLESLGDWLEKMNESGELQKDVNDTAKTGVGIFTTFTKILGQFTGAWKKLSDFNKSLPDPRKVFGPLPFGIAPLRERGDFGRGVSGGGGNFPISPAGVGGPISARVRRPLSLQGRFNLAQLQLAQAGLTATLADDRRILEVEEAITRQQIASAKTLKDKTRLTQQLVGITDQIHGIEQQTTDQIKEQNQALRDRADAIKSSILDRLQQQQTGRENQRALRDAKEQLRLARLIGGPAGIRGAARDVQDAQFRIFMAQVEAAKPRLGRGPGGQTFALGNVITINVHGADSPEKVAAQVAAVLKRRARHTSTQSRGPAAGVG